MKLHDIAHCTGGAWESRRRVLNGYVSRDWSFAYVQGSQASIGGQSSLESSMIEDSHWYDG